MFFQQRAVIDSKQKKVLLRIVHAVDQYDDFFVKAVECVLFHVRILYPRAACIAISSKDLLLCKPRLSTL